MFGFWLDVIKDFYYFNELIKLIWEFFDSDKVLFVDFVGNVDVWMLVDVYVFVFEMLEVFNWWFLVGIRFSY